MTKKKELRPYSAHVYLIDGEKHYYTNTLFDIDNAIYLGLGVLPKLAPLNISRKGVKPAKKNKSYFTNGMKCCYCEKNLTKETCTKEHILAKSRGGTLVLPACKKCNSEKSDKTIQEYISYLINKDKEVSDLNKIKISNAIHISMTTKIS